MPAISKASGGVKPSAVRIWLLAARPKTLPAAIAPVLVGSALALREGRFNAQAALLCLGFALLIQIGTNFANDYFDFMKGADTEARVGPKRAVAAGWVKPGTMCLAMSLVFSAAFVVGLGLASRGGPWLIAIGVASILCGIAYTGGPFPLGYLGLGDLFVFIFFGLVAVCATFFVQAGRVPSEVILAAIPVGLLAANILLVNNYRDFQTDAAAGKRTLVVRFGRNFARGQFGFSLAIAFVVPVLFCLRGWGWSCLLPLILIPMAVSQSRRLKSATSASELIGLLGDAGKFTAFYAALFALGVNLTVR